MTEKIGDQNKDELLWFIDILRREGVKKYLEVGSKAGGALLAVGRALAPGAKIYSIDMCVHDRMEAFRKAMEKIRHAGNTADLIQGDSTEPRVVAKARKYGPYDAIFIDANHKWKYVAKDFENYRTMTKIIAFHDIGWASGFDTVAFWKSIKDDFRNEEFIAEEGKNGIGVIWL